MKETLLLLLFLLLINCSSSKENLNYNFPEKLPIPPLPLTSKDKNTFLKIKGDFKCIKLGDAENVVMKKLKYLGKTDKEWENALIEYIFYNNRDSRPSVSYNFGDYNTMAYFYYFKDKLYKIIISFDSETSDDYYTITKTQYDEAVKIYLKKYGKSKYYKTISFSEKESNFIIYSAKWELKKKTILIGINYYKSKYNCEIYLIDKKLNKREKLENKNKMKPTVPDKIRNDF